MSTPRGTFVEKERAAPAQLLLRMGVRVQQRKGPGVEWKYEKQ
jgi:hypothetical protein